MESLRSGKPWEVFARPSFSADRPAIPRLRDAFLHILTRNMIYFSQLLSFSQKNGKSCPMNSSTTFGGPLIMMQLYVVSHLPSLMIFL